MDKSRSCVLWIELNDKKADWNSLQLKYFGLSALQSIARPWLMGWPRNSCCFNGNPNHRIFFLVAPNSMENDSKIGHVMMNGHRLRIKSRNHRLDLTNSKKDIPKWAYAVEVLNKFTVNSPTFIRHPLRQSVCLSLCFDKAIHNHQLVSFGKQRKRSIEMPFVFFCFVEGGRMGEKGGWGGSKPLVLFEYLFRNEWHAAQTKNTDRKPLRQDGRTMCKKKCFVFLALSRWWVIAVSRLSLWTVFV